MHLGACLRRLVRAQTRRCAAGRRRRRRGTARSERRTPCVPSSSGRRWIGTRFSPCRTAEVEEHVKHLPRSSGWALRGTRSSARTPAGTTVCWVHQHTWGTMSMLGPHCTHRLTTRLAAPCMCNAETSWARVPLNTNMQRSRWCPQLSSSSAAGCPQLIGVSCPPLLSLQTLQHSAQCPRSPCSAAATARPRCCSAPAPCAARHSCENPFHCPLLLRY